MVVARLLRTIGWALVMGVFASLTAAQASAQDSGLRYFGYFAARITESGGNHLAEVGYRSNLNWVQISDPTRYAPEVLDGCAPRGCIISTGHEFFTGCDSAHSPDCGLHPDYVARWNRLASAVGSRIDKVGAFYLMDEPQFRGASPQEVQQAAATIKATYPTIPVMMVEAGPQVTPSLQVPQSVDWVGFDWYCRPFSDVERTLATLTTRIHPHQSLFLVPEAAPLEACGGAPGHATDAEIAPLQYEYFELAQSNPRVIGLLNFGFWTSGHDSADLPQTVAAHEDIFARITAQAPGADLPVAIAGQRARINGRGAIRVRLKCPVENASPCAGELSLRRRKSRGRSSLGARDFSLAPATKRGIRVRVARSKRHRLVKQSKRRKGVKVRAHASTPAGESVKTLIVRRKPT